MKYLHIDGIDKDISRIAFGCAIAPMLEGREVGELLDACFAMGINTFDTAENYGQSERCLGDWLRTRKNRDKVVIITKGCHPYGRDRVNPEDLKKDIEASFEKLGTDYIDVYFLHRDDLKIHPGIMVEVLNEYHKQGRIGAFGGSNWSHERIELANTYAKEHGLVPFTVSSPNFGLADQIGDPFGGGAGCVSLSGPKNAEAREWYLRNDMPVFAYSSIGRGFFSGRVKSEEPERAGDFLDKFAVKGFCYPENFERLRRVELLAAKKNATVPQLAMAWTLAQPLKTVLLASAQSAERVASNRKALEIELTPMEQAWLDLREDTYE